MTTKTKFKQTEIGMIPEDWDIIKGEDCLILDIGSRPKGGVTDIGDIPSLGGEHVDLTSHRIDFQKSPKYVSKEYFNQMKNGKLKINDILINKDGAYTGKLAFVWELFSSEIVINEHLFIIRNKGQLDQRFLFYYLSSNQGEYQIKQNITGSAQPGLNTQFIKKILLPKPNLSEQIKISEILFNLDLKINIILSKNKTLEAIGQAIFKRWFVDFEFPDEEGKPYKSSGGEMVYNEELGKEIPKGWKVEKAVNFFKLEYGWHLPAWDRKEGKIPVFGSGGLSGYHNESFVKGAGIIIGRAGKIGSDSIYYSHKDFCPLETTFYVSTNNKLLIRYLYFFIKTMSIINTGSSVPNLSRNSIHNYQIIIPDLSMIKRFDILVEKLFDMKYRNEEEIKTLAQIRDSLLPKLMSGKIRVPLEHK